MNWWGFRGVRSTRRRPCLRRLGRNLRRPLPPSLFVVRGFHQRREILVSGAGFRCEEHYAGSGDAQAGDAIPRGRACPAVLGGAARRARAELGLPAACSLDGQRHGGRGPGQPSQQRLLLAIDCRHCCHDCNLVVAVHVLLKQRLYCDMVSMAGERRNRQLPIGRLCRL